MNLAKRIDRLEQAAPTEQGFCIHWTFPENTNRIMCAGQEFSRQNGESMSDFTNRAAATVTAAVPGAILWMDSRLRGNDVAGV